jgi:hypothetical protein
MVTIRAQRKAQSEQRTALGCAVRFALLAMLCALPLHADQVIMKDGTVYKGKILIDTDKALLIGNPPFDPNSYLLQADEIEKIIYEEYHPNPPAERKRGFIVESRIDGTVFSSDVLSYSAAKSLYLGAGFRVHPLVELNGGLDWTPALHARDAFSVSDGTTTRRYEDFWQYSAVFSARLYPFFNKKWKTEPYAVAGYNWSHQIPKGSGDMLKGSGWHVGAGFIRPLTTHIFLEGRFVFQKMNFDTIQFLGHEGTIQPQIDQSLYIFSLGASYRL